MDALTGGNNLVEVRITPKVPIEDVTSDASFDLTNFINDYNKDNMTVGSHLSILPLMESLISMKMIRS